MLPEENARQPNMRLHDLPDYKNLVAFYELALKIDKRLHPELYQDEISQQNND
ncbi:MAG TPA: hypothetical protein VF817_01625 [Patescibacteria group bacterium]